MERERKRGKEVKRGRWRERERGRERRDREREEVKRDREGGDKEKGERETGNTETLKINIGLNSRPTVENIQAEIESHPVYRVIVIHDRTLLNLY